MEMEGLQANGDPATEAKWLVGKLITKRPFHAQSMFNLFKVIWRLSRSTMAPNLFLFKFASVRDKEKIIDGGPWAFDSQMLTLQDFDSNLRPEEYVFDKTLFWLRVNRLPWNLMSMEIAERMGNKIGELVKMDTSQRE